MEGRCETTVPMGEAMLSSAHYAACIIYDVEKQLS